MPQNAKMVQTVPPKVGGGGEGAVCPSPPVHVRGIPKSAELLQIRSSSFTPQCTMHNLLHSSTWLFLVQVEINKHPCPQAVPLESEGFQP